jgi:hypothetical protein
MKTRSRGRGRTARVSSVKGPSPGRAATGGASPSWWSRARKPHGAPVPSFSVAGPIVRIHLPPADSPSLVGYLLPLSKSRLLPRRARARPGGTAGRDTQGPSTSRQLPVTSLSSLIPVPRCRLRGLGTVRDRSTASALLVTCRCWLGVAPDRAQAKPSTVRCSGQPSGRRECTSSLSAVRSGG